MRAPARLAIEVYGQTVESALPEKAKRVVHLPKPAELLASLPDAKVLPALRLHARMSRLTLAEVLESPHLKALAETGDDGVLRAILGLDGRQALDFAPREALLALKRLDTPRAPAYPSTQSPLALALSLLRVQSRSTHPHAPAALATVVRLLSPLATNPETAGALSRVLPEMAVRAITGGEDVTLATPPEHARAVLSTLAPLLAGEAWGKSTAPAAARLAQAYSPDPAFWTPAAADPGLGISGIQLSVSASGEGERLSRALDAGVGHGLKPTAADTLTALAPELVASLGTAVQPPLGLPSTIAAGVGNASDYAGKVYSAHEFRRERDTASGLGLGATGVGRKASRHVDEFGR